jgi:hypothetical protein
LESAVSRWNRMLTAQKAWWTSSPGPAADLRRR